MRRAPTTQTTSASFAAICISGQLNERSQSSGTTPRPRPLPAIGRSQRSTSAASAAPAWPCAAPAPAISSGRRASRSSAAAWATWAGSAAGRAICGAGCAAAPAFASDAARNSCGICSTTGPRRPDSARLQPTSTYSASRSAAGTVRAHLVMLSTSGCLALSYSDSASVQEFGSRAISTSTGEAAWNAVAMPLIAFGVPWSAMISATPMRPVMRA